MSDLQLFCSTYPRRTLHSTSGHAFVGEGPAMFARIGGGLILGAMGLAAVTAGVLNWGWSIGANGAAGVMTLAELVVFGVGCLFIVAARPAPVPGGLARWALLLLAAGVAGLVGSAVRSTMIANDLLGDWLAAWLLFGGLAAVPIGLVGVGIGHVMVPGARRWIGAALILGTILLGIGLPLNQPVVELLGSLLIVMGLAGIALLSIALQVPSASRPTRAT